MELRFTWSALNLIKDELGADYTDTLSRALDERNLDALAIAIAAGTDQTPDEVMAESPPIEPMYKAVVSALVEAFHGPDGPQEGEQREGKTGFSRFWKTRRNQA